MRDFYFVPLMRNNAEAGVGITLLWFKACEELKMLLLVSALGFLCCLFLGIASDEFLKNSELGRHTFGRFVAADEYEGAASGWQAFSTCV